MTGDPWREVVGQAAAVGALTAAVERSVHAYLFVGAEGHGSALAARVFAGELLAATDPGSAERHRRLAVAGAHPAVWEVRRSGASISADDARDIVRRAAMTPAEGNLQVIVLHEFHLVGVRAPILLKTIEEPNPATVFVVIADEVTPELVTIASRCVRIDFPPIPVAVITSTLTQEGVPAEVAATAAASSGGDLARARLLATDPELLARRAFWLAVPGRLDGSGATAAVLVDEARARIDALLGPYDALAASETEALEASYERVGGMPAGVAREVKERHARERRRVRTDELRAGLGSLLAAYREGVDRPGGARAFAQAADLVDAAATDLVRNPNEALLLQALFLRLPRPG